MCTQPVNCVYLTSRQQKLGGGMGTYNFAALNIWDRFRVWLGHGTGLFPETFLKLCGGVMGVGTHISPNEWVERDYHCPAFFALWNNAGQWSLGTRLENRTPSCC